MNNGYETTPYQQMYIYNQNPNILPRKNKKKNNIIPIILMVFSFLCFVVFVVLIIFYNSKENKNNTQNKSLVNVDSVFQNAYNATVMVKRYIGGTFKDSGSGFIYKTDSTYAYILTNEHVVSGTVVVGILNKNNKEVEGNVLGSDKYLDIAVVRIKKEDAPAVVKVNTKDNLKIGDKIFAIGTPVAETYFNSVTSGIISGIDRKLTLNVERQKDWIQKTIQVDAAINPGNSGGPLVNDKGEVIGINSIKLIDKTVEGMGFAIKMSDVVRHTKTLEANLKITRPKLGIRYLDINDKNEILNNHIVIPNNITEGIVVVNALSGSSAYNSGLRKGDIIVKINDEKVYNQAYLKYILYQYEGGNTVDLYYYRDSKLKKTKVTLENQ